MAKLESSRCATLILNILEWITIPTGIETFEPRYRVLVGRPGSEASIGVATARTLRRAIKEMDQVDRVLAASSHEQVQGKLDLDF